MNEKKDLLSHAADVAAEVEKELNAALGGQSHEAFMEEASGPRKVPVDGDEAGGEGSAEGEQEKPAEGGDFKYQLKRGRISGVTGDDVFVELMGVSGKNQGVVPITQFDRPPRVGSIMDFVVERWDEAEGLAILSREGAVTQATWQQLDKGSVTEARVTGTNKGGLELELVGNINAFMPASQIDFERTDDFEKYVGEKLKAVVTEVDRKSKRVVLSHRRYLEIERKRQQEALMKELAEDQVREGTVRSIVQFGAFVDLGGVDGLLHISDMAHSRIHKPEEVVNVGDTVRVKVLKVDKENERISLGLKQVTPDPWENLDLTAGEDVSARVVRLTNFGAFLEVQEGIEGLLPLSEMSWKRIGHPKEVASEGDVVKVKVLDIDPKKKRLTFSIKQVTGDPWADVESKYPRNEVVNGRVTRVVDFGAFVELESGVEGMVHISELANKRVDRVEDIVKVGDDRQFRVIEVDPENRRIRLSIKAVDAPLPEEKPEEQTKGKKQARKINPKDLSGGLGSAGGLGVGLGNLKL